MTQLKQHTEEGKPEGIRFITETSNQAPIQPLFSYSLEQTPCGGYSPPSLRLDPESQILRLQLPFSTSNYLYLENKVPDTDTSTAGLVVVMFTQESKCL